MKVFKGLGSENLCRERDSWTLNAMAYNANAYYAPMDNAITLSASLMKVDWSP